MPPLFVVGPVLSWRERYVRSYVFAYCACGWGLVLFGNFWAGKVCFYFLCFQKTSLWTRPKATPITDSLQYPHTYSALPSDLGKNILHIYWKFIFPPIIIAFAVGCAINKNILHYIAIYCCFVLWPWATLELIGQKRPRNVYCNTCTG